MSLIITVLVACNVYIGQMEQLIAGFIKIMAENKFGLFLTGRSSYLAHVLCFTPRQTQPRCFTVITDTKYDFRKVHYEGMKCVVELRITYFFFFIYFSFRASQVYNI